jgi:hypothetical protein
VTAYPIEAANPNNPTVKTIMAATISRMVIPASESNFRSAARVD